MWREPCEVRAASLTRLAPRNNLNLVLAQL
jgi:hypothetical protein